MKFSALCIRELKRYFIIGLMVILTAAGVRAESDENSDPPAETVPLPVRRFPEQSKDAPQLRLDSPQIKLGEKIVFGLIGPENFLSLARGTYVIEDTIKREIARGTLTISTLPFDDGKPRRIEIALPSVVMTRHRFQLILEAEGFETVKLQSEFEVVLSNSAAAPRGLTVLVSRLPSEKNWDALYPLGVSGGVQYRLHAEQRESFRKVAASFYVENISRGLFSRYHTERGAWAKTISDASDPEKTTRFWREPSLSSREFSEVFAQEITSHAEAFVKAKEKPLFYSLASEPSVTRLSAAFDFDFTPVALAEFQRWLERDVYGSIAALNTSWDTRFEKWADVVPMTTDEVFVRYHDKVLNFAPWMDFRDFQDYQFAHILKGGAELLHSMDPNAQVGITGAMGAFAFGGWDWSRLSKSLDVVEAYDIGQARSLWRDLARGKSAYALLPLVFSNAQVDKNTEIDPTDKVLNVWMNEVRSILWPLVLEGGPRGVVLWEPAATSVLKEKELRSALMSSDGKLSAVGTALSPLLRILTSEVGLLLSHCRREDETVAMLYSPATIRVRWLLEADALHGTKWLAAWGANTAGERTQSAYLRLRESWGKLLDDLGLQWSWFSSAQLSSGELLKPTCRIRILVLPQILALSNLEITQLKKFVEKGGQLVVDAACGRFDDHGVSRKTPPFDELFQLDTTQEPLLPRAMNPLESVKMGELLNGNAEWNAESMRQFPTVFSEEPRWATDAKKKISAGEYRRSPVGVVSAAGSYLNLDLSDYLRWRLHPDRPRAAVVRKFLMTHVFQLALNEYRIDWSATKLPVGTQWVWLCPERERRQKTNAMEDLNKDAIVDKKELWVLALRRNPQARLHEYGTESENNGAFEKSEEFTIAFKTPMTVQSLLASANELADNVASIKKIQGVLDPFEPQIFVVRSVPAETFIAEAPADAMLGTVVKIKISTAGENKSAALYRLNVFAPDGIMKTCYTRASYCDDGAVEFALPLALNDPVGTWTLKVRDVLGGTEKSLKLLVKQQE